MSRSPGQPRAQKANRGQSQIKLSLLARLCFEFSLDLLLLLRFYLFYSESAPLKLAYRNTPRLLHIYYIHPVHTPNPSFNQLAPSPPPSPSSIVSGMSVVVYPPPRGGKGIL